MTVQNKIIFELTEQVLSECGSKDWAEVSKRLARIYGVVKTPNACRKSYEYYVRSKPQDKTPELKRSLEMRNDGTQISERIIKISETDMKDQRFILEAHGFDPDEFDIVSVKNNLWQTSSADNGPLNSYQSKITVKPKDEGKLTKEDIISAILEAKPEPRLLELIRQDGKYALEIDLADIHIGALSWHAETGEDNDYKITQANIRRIISQARELIEIYPIEKVYLCFLGDFFHVDTEEGTTTKGTKVDFDTRPKKMIQKGYEVIMAIIEAVAMVPTEVKWIPGNHSRNIEFAVFYAMPIIYQNAKHISFDVGPRGRKAFMYGDVLVGLEHGEISKENRYTWLQVEYREEWGRSRYAEIHSGHLHHEEVQTKGGIRRRTNPTPKPVDNYEYNEGYVGTPKEVLCYLWDKQEGLKSVHYLK